MKSLKNSLYFDYHSKKEVPLDLPREKMASWLYETVLGRIANKIFSQPFLSQILGWYAKSPLSYSYVAKFKEEFSINDDDFIVNNKQTLHDYFIRPFQKEKRFFDPKMLCSPAEGYLLICNQDKLPIKGLNTSSYELCKRKFTFPIQQSLVIRLSPREYHRFHFPCDGMIEDIWQIHGKLYSINPITIQYDPHVFIRNLRTCLLLKLKNETRLIMVLIGAPYIGSIQIHRKIGDSFRQGEEAGYFTFGGSTAVLFLEKKVSIDPIIFEYSDKGVECLIRLGTNLEQT